MRRGATRRVSGCGGGPRNILRRILIHGLWTVVLTHAACAASSFTTSASGRFLVVGRDPSSNVEFARWAEAVAEQCQILLGEPLPIRRGQPLEIMLVESRTAGSVVTPGRRDDGRCTLTVTRPEAVDGVSLREAFVRLMLEGIIERRRREAGLPVSEADIPPWLLAGLAANLEKGVLGGHRSVLTMTGVESGGFTPVAEIVQWVSLPEGWQGPRALCGLATAWVLSFPAALNKILEHMTAGEPLSPDWMARNVVGVVSVVRMEEQWRAWRERQSRAIQEFGSLTTGLIHELKTIPLLDAAPTEKIQRIRALILGKAPELVEAGELYCRYYEAVDRGAWQLTQRRRLARAVATLDRLEILTRDREEYVDSFESLVRRGGGAAPCVLDKSDMESYLDEAEKRFDKR